MMTAVALGAAIAVITTGQAEARDNRPGSPIDSDARCVYFNRKTGEWEFYLPGSTLTLRDQNGDDHFLVCGRDGTWVEWGVP
jgi:hypothetical protein